jgi:hypothetical protein
LADHGELSQGFRKQRPEGPELDRRLRIIVLWLLLSVVGLSIGGYFRRHYLLQALPAVALLSSAGLVYLGRRLSRRNRYLLYSAGGLAIVLCCILQQRAYYGAGSPTAKARWIYGDNPFPESIAAGRLLRERSGPADKVFILGSEPQLLFYAGLQSATRYIFMFPLTVATRDAQRRQEEALAEFRRERPRFVVSIFSVTSFLPQRGLSTKLFEDIGAEVRSGYRLVGLAVRGSETLLIGDHALHEWREHPTWYPPHDRFSLALWERKAE